MGKETKESGQRSAASDGRDSLDTPHCRPAGGGGNEGTFAAGPAPWFDWDLLHQPTRRTELRNWLRHALNGDKLL